MIFFTPIQEYMEIADENLPHASILFRPFSIVDHDDS